MIVIYADPDGEFEPTQTRSVFCATGISASVGKPARLTHPERETFPLIPPQTFMPKALNGLWTTATRMVPLLEMCGNGTRATALFAQRLDSARCGGEPFRLEPAGGNARLAGDMAHAVRCVPWDMGVETGDGCFQRDDSGD